MKEISKKQLLNQINEIDYSNRKVGKGLYIGRDEFGAWEKESHPDARAERGLPREYPKRPKGAGESPDWFDRRAARAFEAELGGPPLSDMMIIDDPENEDGLLVVVQRDGIDITLITEETLQEENPDFYAWATTPPNRLAFIDLKNKIGRDWFGGRRPKEDAVAHYKRREEVSAVPFSGEQYLPRGEDEKRIYSEREKILRKINPLIREFSAITKQQLNAAGLPEIVAPYHKYREQTENINKYTTINNKTILWSTLNIFLYDADEYIQNAKDMYRPSRPNSTPPKLPKSRHAVRKDNPGRNWSITRPSEIKSQSYKENPLTPRYQLNKGGYEADDVDYMVATAFTFRGQATEDNRFVWELEFQTQYGDKLKEATRIEGGLITDETNINFVSTASTGVLEEMLGPDGSIATNDAIMDAFKEALSDMTSKIGSIDARKELYRRYAGKGKADITLQLNESINSIVSKIINELKQ
jgi:hypothetical protein